MEVIANPISSVNQKVEIPGIVGVPPHVGCNMNAEILIAVIADIGSHNSIAVPFWTGIGYSVYVWIDCSITARFPVCATLQGIGGRDMAICTPVIDPCLRRIVCDIVAIIFGGSP